MEYTPAPGYASGILTDNTGNMRKVKSTKVVILFTLFVVTLFLLLSNRSETKQLVVYQDPILESNAKISAVSSPAIEKSHKGNENVIQISKVILQTDVHAAERSSKNASYQGFGDIKKYGQFHKLFKARQTIARLHDDYFKLRQHKVNPINTEYIIENKRFCDKENNALYLLIIIPSIPGDAMVRHVFRETIGSYTSGTYVDQLRTKYNSTVRAVFVVGSGPNEEVNEQLQKENKIHGDIVQAKFQDTYRNLTKKMLVALKWVVDHCSNVDYVLKLDADVFVNIPVLLTKLHAQQHFPRGQVLGFIYPSGGSAKRYGKWKVTKEEYPLDNYPPYASGNAYVISGNLVPWLVSSAEYLPYLPIEDAFITGCLVKVVGARLVQVPGFSKWTDAKPEPCLFIRKRAISATKVTSDLMNRLWNAQNNFKKMCHVYN